VHLVPPSPDLVDLFTVDNSPEFQTGLTRYDTIAIAETLQELELAA
jgi:hypothetical protein